MNESDNVVLKTNPILNKIKYYVKSQNGIKTIPNFLINHNTNDVDDEFLFGKKFMAVFFINFSV